MKIDHIRVIHARIPLKKQIKHASHVRNENDTILVRCLLSDGTIGWGEGLPRPYVTGETIESAWNHLTKLPSRQLEFPIREPDATLHDIEEIEFPIPTDKRDCFGNAARCALELAILDACGQLWERPLSKIIADIPGMEPLIQRRNQVRYVSVMTSMSYLKTVTRSVLFRCNGFQQCKVKVGVNGVDDAKMLRLIRRIMGQRTTLRLDANEAWQPDELERKVAPLLPCVIASLEQPVRHENVSGLASIRQRMQTPIMLDESLCSISDGKRAIEQGLCDLFNVRLSKCGGVIRSARLAKMATDARLAFQLGCQVGETGILSAAGRQFATVVGNPVAVEGSFDRHLVKEPLTTTDLTFGFGGMAPVLKQHGLGVTIDPAAVERVTVKQVDVKIP